MHPGLNEEEMSQRIGAELLAAQRKDVLFGFEVEPGMVVSILSLPMGVFARIQERTGMGFVEVWNDPIRNLSVAAELLEACRAKAGIVGAPEPSIEELVEMLVRTPSDLPPEPILFDDGSSLDPTYATATPGS